MKKTTLFLSCLMACATLSAAPIEQRNLSTATNTVLVNQSQQNMQVWELKQEVEKLQAQVRQLLGKLEERDHQLEQLNSEIQNRYTDLDQRLQILNEQLNPPEPEDTPETSAAPAQASTEAIDVGSDKAAFDNAYTTFQKGGAKKGILAMQNFIDTHPQSKYISDAYYHLGNFNLAVVPPNVHQARESFEIIAGNYPNSTKAPGALYNLIEIAINNDQDINRARQYYQQLIQKYSASQEAKTARNSFSL